MGCSEQMLGIQKGRRGVDLQFYDYFESHFSLIRYFFLKQKGTLKKEKFLSQLSIRL